MRRYAYGFVFLMLALMLSPVVAQDSEPYTETTDCWMELPDGLTEGQDVDCGYLFVPEDRTAADSPTIQLAYAIYYASGDSVQPDPVVYLAGGPGGNAVGELEGWLDTDYIQDRNLILLDQRGTGYSMPSLNCVEDDEGQDDATQACHDRLVDEGVNLQAYNSAENAADVADLRMALGIEEWNVYGVSYGTRLALTIMRDHPDGVRSVIIDSVYPPEVSSWEEYGANTADVFSRLFAACAGNSDCNDAYPNLEQVFNDTVEQLNADPAFYTGTDADTGEETDQELTGDALIDRLFQVLYNSASIPSVPWVINEVANGNYIALDELESGSTDVEKLRQDEDVSDSEGMNLSVECQEEVAFIDENTALDNVPNPGSPLHNNSILSIQSTFSDCAIWNVAAANDIETQPVKSDIPTLVVAGEFDPITPAKWAQSAASILPNSFFYVFPGGGHGVIDLNECSTGIMQEFLDAPTQEPDASCIANIGEPDWVLP